MSKLPQEKYIGDTVSIARDLLGRCLVRMWQGQPLVCRIVETEAYVGAVDKAAHAYGYHRTQRNAVMFGPPGHAYIYLIYGMHCCLNFVTEPEGEPSAVLLRGLEPVWGTEQMSLLRYGKPLAQLSTYQRKNFLNGPGKCCGLWDLAGRKTGWTSPGTHSFSAIRRRTSASPRPRRQSISCIPASALASTTLRKP